MITDSRIDNGKAFDWGRTSKEYSLYRDIYPVEFYEKIHSLGLCTSGQSVLDLGTGTGVLPRNMYSYGAKFTGTDISENQIMYAKSLSEKNNMNIDYFVAAAEETDFPESSFDVITACQCHFYFNHQVFAPLSYKILKTNGNLAFLYMAWLPFDDDIAKASEDLILKYNPSWSGCKEKRHHIIIPNEYNDYFKLNESVVFDVNVPFTIESWNGRIKACRGIGASLSDNEIQKFEEEHLSMLNSIGKQNFNVLHYCAIAVIGKK